VSRAHDVLFRGAIYLPMAAAMLAYTHLAPSDYEAKPYFALNFGSGYALGASNASFLLVLAVHHEVQYLYLTYAMARRQGSFYAATRTANGRPTIELDAKMSENLGQSVRTEVKSPCLFYCGP
jgi:hypothetical protein